MLLVTNNERVRDRFAAACQVAFVPGGHHDVLLQVRDLVHKGRRLLTHPLAGSVKPNETPYRTVALSDMDGALDLDSLQLIEDALATFQKLKPRAGRGLEADSRMKEDFAEIDLRLIEGAVGPHLQKGE